MTSSPRPRIAWISPSGSSTSTPSWLEGSIQQISTPDQLLQGPEADVIVVDGFTDAGPILQELRTQPNNGLRLIYLNAEGAHSPPHWRTAPCPMRRRI